MQLICNVWILRFAQDDSAGLLPRSYGVTGHYASNEMHGGALPSSLPLLERQGGDVRCRPRGNSSSNLHLPIFSQTAQCLSSWSCGHPEEAESLACERLPTKDLCTCSGNGPPKCRPIALTERLFRTVPQQRHAKVPAWMPASVAKSNQIRLERKRIEKLRLYPPKPKSPSSRALPEPRWRGEGKSRDLLLSPGSRVGRVES